MAVNAAAVDSNDARPCPWCGQWALKDPACNWVCCGLSVDRGFVRGAGCGMQWCFLCARKLCSRLFDPESGDRLPGVSTNHSAACCGFEGYCPGGHNSHKPPSDVSRPLPMDHPDRRVSLPATRSPM